MNSKQGTIAMHQIFSTAKKLLCVGMIIVATLTDHAALASDDLKQCVEQKVTFDGIQPLQYADVTGEPNEHVTLNRQHPQLCKSTNDAACTGKAYLVPGDAVAIANTCGDYAHVQFIGQKAVSYGWVNLARLKKVISVPSIQPFIHSYDSPPHELENFVGKAEKIVDWKVNDLNLDGRSDYLLVLASKEDDSQRIIVIIDRQRDGSLREVSRNKTIIICDVYSGSHGGFGITAYRGSFEIRNSWGDTHAIGWQRLRFDWNSAKKQWVLSTFIDGYDSDDPEEHSSNTVASKEYGEITFNKIDGDRFGIQWKNRG